MLASLFTRLNHSSPGPAPLDDSRLALAVLLVRVGRTDNEYLESEQERIDWVLAQRYGLSAEQATQLRHEAELLEADAPDSVRFTRLLKDAVPIERRCAVLEALWSVVLTDDRRDFEEDGFMRLITKLLGVNDRDNALARQRAARTLK